MMINRSTFMMSASAIICVCCGLSFADPATDTQVGNGKEILKEVQVQRYEIARATRVRRRGYVSPNYGAYNTQSRTASVGKDEHQKEEKVVKDEQTNAAQDAAAKREQKEANVAAQTERKDANDAAQTEQKDANDAAQAEQKDANDETKAEQKDADDAAQTEQKDAKGDETKAEQKDAKGDETKAEQKDAKNDEAKEPASPFKDPQAALAFKEFNNFRVRCGLRPCEFNQNLQNIAQWHSNNMYNRRQMYHSGMSGVAENVFMGNSSGVYAVRVWMNSPGHRANMLGPYRRVGIARTGGFFTMVLQ